jgi:archaeal type IV pilus assembly protein PilA
MNTYLRKIKKNSKALSPVVASIILIAVTVAVSVVVAAWMGGMSLGLMGNAEQLSVTNVQFNAATPNTVTISIRNNGGSDATISKVYVNSQTSFGSPVTAYSATPAIIAKGTITDVVVNLNWASATSYEFKFTTAKGNNIAYTQVAP